MTAICLSCAAIIARSQDQASADLTDRMARLVELSRRLRRLSRPVCHISVAEQGCRTYSKITIFATRRMK